MNNVPEFDPYKILLQKKFNQTNSSEIPVISYNEEDIKELEEFCKKHGILGVNFKNMNPKSVLNMLKNKIGIREEKSNRMVLNG